MWINTQNQGGFMSSTMTKHFKMNLIDNLKVTSPMNIHPIISIGKFLWCLSLSAAEIVLTGTTATVCLAGL